MHFGDGWEKPWFSRGRTLSGCGYCEPRDLNGRLSAFRKALRPRRPDGGLRGAETRSRAFLAVLCLLRRMVNENSEGTKCLIVGHFGLVAGGLAKVGNHRGNGLEVSAVRSLGVVGVLTSVTAAVTDSRFHSRARGAGRSVGADRRCVRSVGIHRGYPAGRGVCRAYGGNEQAVLSGKTACRDSQLPQLARRFRLLPTVRKGGNHGGYRSHGQAVAPSIPVDTVTTDGRLVPYLLTVGTVSILGESGYSGCHRQSPLAVMTGNPWKRWSRFKRRLLSGSAHSGNSGYGEHRRSSSAAVTDGPSFPCLPFSRCQLTVGTRRDHEQSAAADCRHAKRVPAVRSSSEIGDRRTSGDPQQSVPPSETDGTCSQLLRLLPQTLTEPGNSEYVQSASIDCQYFLGSLTGGSPGGCGGYGTHSSTRQSVVAVANNGPYQQCQPFSLFSRTDRASRVVLQFVTTASQYIQWRLTGSDSGYQRGNRGYWQSVAAVTADCRCSPVSQAVGSYCRTVEAVDAVRTAPTVSRYLLLSLIARGNLQLVATGDSDSQRAHLSP